MTAPTTTILVSSFNRPHLLKWGLLSLSKQVCKYKFDVLVINDGLPDDETYNLCKSFSSKLKMKYLFTGQRNLNRKEPWWRIPGYSINIGVKAVQSDIIILACAETYLIDVDTVESMIDYLIQHPTTTISPIGIDDRGGYLEKLESGLRITSADFDNDTVNSRLNLTVPVFKGLFRKHFIRLGGYDEDFKGIGFDDDDLSYRFQVYGMSMDSIPKRMVHLYHKRLWNPALGEREIYNRDLYYSRRRPGNIIRNKGRDWGVL